MMKPVIVNVVATSDLGQQVDLSKVKKIRNILFHQHPHRDGAAYIKTQSMHGRITLFNTGKLISIGSRSTIEAQEDLQTTANILAEHNIIKLVRLSAEIGNIVSVLDLSETIDLEAIAEKHLVIYEPEIFPAVIIRTHFPKATLLIFSTGKIIITGVKHVIELKEVSEIVMHLLNINLESKEL